MSGVVELQIWQFTLVYFLLIVVVAIMKKCKIDQTKILITASIKMTVQLILAGLILTYIFKNPHPLFTATYIIAMTSFAIHQVLSKNKALNKRFKFIIAGSMGFSGIVILVFFVSAIVGESIFNPQYAIPISGMVMGNTMTGVSLGVKTLQESLIGQRVKINALICAGAAPKKILLPFVSKSLETAMLPTINSMVGMGIVSLPGMMTGQILAGTLPTTAILYQIAIMISICTSVTCASFGALFFGYKTLFDKQTQIIYQ